MQVVDQVIQTLREIAQTEVMPRFLRVGSTRKSDGTLFTEADLASVFGAPADPYDADAVAAAKAAREAEAAEKKAAKEEAKAARAAAKAAKAA